MSLETPNLRRFALHLTAYEIKAAQLSVESLPAVFGICEKLRPQLSTLVGKTGFHALLSRALALASREVPALKVIQLRTDGTFSGVDLLKGQMAFDEINESGAILLSHLFGLLVSFIGESLTLMMVKEVWPEFSSDDFNLGA